MAEFNFELVSPERVLMSRSVEHVVLPGSEGMLGVLSGHSPAVVTLKPGVISILSGSLVTRKIYVRGGFAEINPESVTVLAVHAVNTEAVDKEAIVSELSVAEKDLADASGDDARFTAQSAIDALKSL